MRAALIALVVVLVLVGGTFMGVAAMFLVPIVAAIALIAIALTLLARKAEDKPPMP